MFIRLLVYEDWVSQDRRDGVVGLAFAGFVGGEDAVFLFPSAYLVCERDFAFDDHAHVAPFASGPLAALDFVDRDRADVQGLLSVKENPTFAFALGLEVANLSGGFEHGLGGASRASPIAPPNRQARN